MWANEDYLNDKRIHDDYINHMYFLDENGDMIPSDIFIKKNLDRTVEKIFFHNFCNNVRRKHGLPTLRRQAYFNHHKIGRITDEYDRRKKRRSF